jgi:CubicO group peptidase (beta-lactamase class C family)
MKISFWNIIWRDSEAHPISSVVQGTMPEPRKAAYKRAVLAALVVSASMPLSVAPTLAGESAGEVEARQAHAFVNAFQAWAGQVQAQQGAIAVLHAARLVGSAGVGGRSPHQPASIASLSKAITGVCVSRLVDAGRLRYEDTVGKLLQSYFARAGHPVDQRMKAVTITQLLTHRSGIVGKVDGPNHAGDISPGMRSPLEEKIRRALRTQLEFQPGSAFSYSNTGYILLSLIIEQVSGRDYQSQCNEAVFAPIGVTGAHIGNSVPARGRSGAGGWQVSAVDYARFLTLLDPRSPTMGPSTQQWIAARDQERPTYALGYHVDQLANGERVLEHNGLLAEADESTSAQFLMLPGDWVVSINVTPARAKAIGDLTKQLKQIAMDGRPTTKPDPTRVAAPRRPGILPQPQPTPAADAHPVCVQGSWAEENDQKRYVCLSWFYQGQLYAPAELEQVLAAQRTSPTSPTSPSVLPEHFEYRGYRGDLSQVISRDDASTIFGSIQKQIDLVEDLPIKPEIKAFFRSIPIVLSPNLHGEGRYSSNGGLQMAVGTEPDSRPILLHEFLHAFHFDKLPRGRANPDIITFYQRAKANSAYPRDSYMLKNPAEFFAMTASAFLHGSVARPPYSRETVMRAQPIYARYLAALFGLQPT